MAERVRGSYGRMPDVPMYLELLGGRVFDLPPQVLDLLARVATKGRSLDVQSAQFRVDQRAGVRP